MDNTISRPKVAQGVYRHFKGNRYFVMGVSIHSETLEPEVVYWPLGRIDELWHRPLEHFLSSTEDGKRRFEYLGPNTIGD